MRPVVSIIVPVHNSARVLGRCLDSLLDQAVRNVEVICVDDASTDESPGILGRFAASDCRMRVVRNEQNRGQGFSRNRGLSLAQGEYVGFVDSDDFIAWDMYQKLYSASNNGSADIVKGLILGFDTEKEEICLRDWYEINHLIARDNAYFCYGYTSAIFRRELLISNNITFPENLITMEDPCFTIEAVFHARDIVLVDDAFYFYTFNKSSSTMSASKDEICESTTRAAAHIIKSLENSPLSPKQRHLIYTFLFHMLYYAINDAHNAPIIKDASALLDRVSQELLGAGTFFCQYFLDEKSKYGRDDIREKRLGQIRQYKRAERNRKAFSRRVRCLVGKGR